MRTRSFLPAGLACLILWGPALHGGESRPTLTAIRYAQQPAGSRLTLEFTGEVRYGFERGTDRLVLSLPGTALGTRWGTGTLAFRDGLVRSVTTRRPATDSLVLVVAVVEGCRATLQRPPAGNVLLLEVARDPDAPEASAVRASARPKASTPPTPAAAEHAATKVARGPGATARETGKTSSPVDIAALARMQLEGARPAAGTQGQTDTRTEDAATSRETSVTTVSGRSDLLLAAGAAAVSIGTTIALLFLLRRRAVRPAAEEPASAPEHLQEKVYRMPEPPELRPLFETPQTDDPGSLYDDQAQIARALRRGKGEVELALALKARTQPRANRQRLARVVEKPGSHAQRRTAARKLGIGVGEVELAVHLKNLQHRTTKEGEGS
jgi:hypothetical protein